MVRLYLLMPWRSSFPCHRMYCEPDTSPVVCFICLSRLLRRLRLAMIYRHASLLHAPKKSIRVQCKTAGTPQASKKLLKGQK